MPVLSDYVAGTITLTNGSAAFTGTGTGWRSAGFREGDTIFDVTGATEYTGVIAAITAEGAGTLTKAWEGPTVTAAYRMRYQADGSRATAQARAIAEQFAVVEANGRGLFFRFSDSVADADPGPGYLRLNNADPASATAAYIDNLDASGATVSGEMDTWDDGGSTIKGRLWLRSIVTGSAFRSYNVTGSVVDGTGYRKLTLAHVGGSGAFTAEDGLMAFFVPKGDKGDPGIDGLDGDDGLSAYQVALANGFVGSEAAWLASLEGADGLDGEDGLDGASQFNRVRAVATGNINLAAPGAAIDTVAMTAGQTFLAAGQTAPAQNGPYVWNGAAVAATRVPALSTYDAMPGVGFRIMEGATKADTTWFCNSNLGGTLGTTALTFAEQVTSAVIASQAEAVAGSENTKSMSPLRVRHVLDGSPLSGYRNKLINGDFDIWQRGVSFSPVNGAFSADRFALLFDGTGATRAITRQSHTLGQTDVPGNPKYFLRFAQSIAGSGATYNALINKIEGVATLSGRDVTITFYAKAAVATSVAVQFIQYFGSGGSPSATVFSALGPHSVGTSWTKIAVKYTLPSVAGKTLGTSGNDYLAVEIDLPINVVSTVDLSHISLVDGDATGEADPFAPRPREQELALCKRYYKLNEPAVGITNTTTLLTVSVAHHPPMRATPTVALVDGVAAVIDIGTNYRDASSVIEADYGGPDGTICRLTIATSTDNHVHAVRGQRISFIAEL